MIWSRKVAGATPARGAFSLAPRRAVAAPTDDLRWQRASRAGRRWALWGGLLGGLAALVLNAPAQWLADALRGATDERLVLADARGSLWNGSAVLVLTGGAGSRDASALPGRLQWQLRPGWRGLHLVATQACCIDGDLRLQLRPQWGGYTLVLGQAPSADTTAGAQPARHLGHWPAAWLVGLGTPWNTLQLGGVLQLVSPGLTLQSVQGRWRLDGALSLELLGVSSRLSSLPVLGSYRVQLQGAGATGDAATLRLDTLAGALQLSGSGQWTGPRLRFRGEARAAEGEAAALSNLLNIIGRRQGALSVISIG
jgi:general secretion pathway protein N